MKKITRLTLAALIPFALYAQSDNEVNTSLNGCAEEVNPTKCESTDGTKGIGVTVKLNVFLEGPFEGNEMVTDLNTQGKIPLTQPFNGPPWNWPGTEAVDSIPNEDIVDWILVDLRDATDPSLATYVTTCGRKAVFLLKDGKIVDLDGQSNVFMQTAYM